MAKAASDFRPRDLLDDGALFFESADALLLHASDGRNNVYEYKNGHIDPISNVSGGNESFFLDASPDGKDVFFATSDQLLPEDTGNSVLVWQARAGRRLPSGATPAGVYKRRLLQTARLTPAECLRRPRERDLQRPRQLPRLGIPDTETQDGRSGKGRKARQGAEGLPQET